LWKIRKHISFEACKTLVHSLVTSRLDFCNSSLYGLPKLLLQKLQHVQNSAARLVSVKHKHDHISPILHHLHWLPVEQRIKFKILLFTFKALNNAAPLYISNSLNYTSQLGPWDLHHLNYWIKNPIDLKPLEWEPSQE